MTATRKYSEQIKAIIVKLAMEDKLPMDMNELDSTVFDEVTEPLVQALLNLRIDARMALTGDWDKSDDGFEAQIDLISSVI